MLINISEGFNLQIFNQYAERHMRSNIGTRFGQTEWWMDGTDGQMDANMDG